MAVPTIATITPATGHPAGRDLVQIAGTNFKLPTTPAPSPTPATTAPTVEVLFGTEPAIRTDVLSAVLLEVTIPPYRGTTASGTMPPVDVTVRNLDAGGTPIPGETVTAAAAFTYTAPSLRPPADYDPIKVVTAELGMLLRRAVLVNTRLVPHTDYSEPGALTAITASVPALYLAMTGAPVDRTRDFPNSHRDVVQSTYVDRYAPALKLRLEYNLIGVSDSKAELTAMTLAVQDLLDRTPYMYVDMGGTRYLYPLQGPEGPTLGFPPSSVDIRTFTWPLEVLDVEIERSGPQSRYGIVDELVIEARDVAGSTAVETILID